MEVYFVSVKYDNSQIWDVRSCAAPFDRPNTCLYKETQIYSISGEYVFTSTYTYTFTYTYIHIPIYIYRYKYIISYIMLMKKSCTSWYGKYPFFTTGFVLSQVVGLGISAINSKFWYQINVAYQKSAKQLNRFFWYVPPKRRAAFIPRFGRLKDQNLQFSLHGKFNGCNPTSWRWMENDVPFQLDDF